MSPPLDVDVDDMIFLPSQFAHSCSIDLLFSTIFDGRSPNFVSAWLPWHSASPLREVLQNTSFYGSSWNQKWRWNRSAVVVQHVVCWNIQVFVRTCFCQLRHPLADFEVASIASLAAYSSSTAMRNEGEALWPWESRELRKKFNLTFFPLFPVAAVIHLCWCSPPYSHSGPCPPTAPSVPSSSFRLSKFDFGRKLLENPAAVQS